MSMTVEADVRVKGGLPLVVRGEVCASSPSVGMYSSYVEGLEFFWSPKRNERELRPVTKNFEDSLSFKDIDLASQALMDEYYMQKNR